MAGSLGGRYSCWRTCRYSYCGRLLTSFFRQAVALAKKHHTDYMSCISPPQMNSLLFDAATTLEALAKTITAEASVSSPVFNYDDYEMLGMAQM